MFLLLDEVCQQLHVLWMFNAASTSDTSLCWVYRNEGDTIFASHNMYGAVSLAVSIIVRNTARTLSLSLYTQLIFSL